MAFEVDKPFRLEFGRGSGMYGLEMIALDEAGEMVIHRRLWEPRGGGSTWFWERASLPVGIDVTRRVAGSIDALGLVAMEKSYHASVHDGLQWILWIVQGKGQKSVYFNNHFPEAIQDFAIALNDIVGGLGEQLQWRRVPAAMSGKHDKGLWRSSR